MYFFLLLNILGENFEWGIHLQELFFLGLAFWIHFALFFFFIYNSYSNSLTNPLIPNKQHTYHGYIYLLYAICIIFQELDGVESKAVNTSDQMALPLAHTLDLLMNCLFTYIKETAFSEGM